MPRPELRCASFLSALSGLGVRPSDRIPHAKGAKGAKGENIGRPNLAGIFYLRVMLTVIVPIVPTITLLSHPSDGAFECVLTGEANTGSSPKQVGKNGTWKWV